MDENRKGLSIAIIVLFIGASVVPSINGNIGDPACIEDLDYVESKKLEPDHSSSSDFHSSLKYHNPSISTETTNFQEEILDGKDLFFKGKKIL